MKHESSIVYNVCKYIVVLMQYICCYVLVLKILYNMREYQKEYEAYMKQITDGFAEMQPHESISPFKGRIPYKVIWDGGTDYKLDSDYDLYLIGINYEEVKVHNSEIAKKYLQSNILTYSEWVAKHKTNL